MERARSGNRFEAAVSYSRAARTGEIVAVSGTAALGPNGAALFPGDARAQTRAAFELALEAAATLGARREHVLRTRIYLAAGADWRGPAEVHGELFDGIDPANTTLFVAGLVPDGCLVEIELDAVVSSDRSAEGLP